MWRLTLMDILIGTSLVAAFLAGIAALLAPCCITVLLPAYFGSIFRTRRKVFLMTFIFFLGVLTVFIPLGLGFAALGSFFSRYHRIIFTLAGIFFLALGALILSGKKFAMPFTVHPKLKGHNAVSVFVLGIFSGIATTCCAPVLAGVLALSVLPGSILWGMAYTLAYVLGMVSPLFIFALMLDSSTLVQRLMHATQPSPIRVFGRVIEIGIAELVAGITFFIVGALTMMWAFMNETTSHSDFQVDVNIAFAQFQQWLGGVIGFMPGFIWVLIVIGVIAFIVRTAMRQLTQEDSSPSQNCHENTK